MKNKPLYEEDILAMLESGEYCDSRQILLERMPSIEKRFDKVCKQMSTLLKDIQEHFPDANYYTGGGDGFDLLLGDSHNRQEKSQQELIALIGIDVWVGGGDW